MFLIHVCRSNSKISSGTHEREGSNTGSCEKPPSGTSTTPLLIRVRVSVTTICKQTRSKGQNGIKASNLNMLD